MVPFTYFQHSSATIRASATAASVVRDSPKLSLKPGIPQSSVVTASGPFASLCPVAARPILLKGWHQSVLWIEGEVKAGGEEMRHLKMKEETDRGNRRKEVMLIMHS